jgi:hypothetical protein
MKRRSALIQLFSVSILLSQIAKSAYAVQRIYPQDFHQGGEDWTEAFQSAINAAVGKQVYVKRGTYQINPVYFKSNVNLFLEAGVIINRYGSYPGGNDCMFNLNDITHVIISGKGAILDMNAQTYPGEWRHNVAIQGSSNIIIQGLKSMRAGGDGFLIGRGLNGKKSCCENITLDRVISESNRRQGLSIISVKGCKIHNSKFLKTSGTAPSTGIDIEPDKPDESLEDISIVNCIFEENKGGAILIAIPRLKDGSAVRIIVSRCKSYRDRHGIVIAERIGSLIGKIEINNIVINQPRYSAILIDGYDSQAAPIYIKSPEIIDPNMLKATDLVNGSVISVGMNNSKSKMQIGNITVENMTLRENLPRAQSVFYVYDVRNDFNLLPQKVYFTKPKSILWDRKRGPAIKVTKGVKLRGIRTLNIVQ